MKMILETLPPEQMRDFEPYGDYDINHEGTTVHVKIVETGRAEYNTILLAHEVIEVLLVILKRIPIGQIDEFDQRYEEARKRGLHAEHEEPGDDPDSPYCHEHCIATSVERMLCSFLGVSWKNYNDALGELSP